MSTEQRSDLAFAGGARISGLPPAVSAGQPLVYGQAGGGSATQVTLTVAAVTQRYAEVVVADAGVSATSKLFAQLVPQLDAENDAEQIGDDSITVHALAEAGQVRFILQSLAALFGPFTVNYQVFA